MNKKILILGANGLLGNNIYNFLISITWAAAVPKPVGKETGNKRKKAADQGPRKGKNRLSEEVITIHV